MRFQTDWIGGGSNACPEERATLCDLRIFVAEHNVCEFFDLVSNERFESLTVPSVNVAEGLATDWWRIFGGRDVTHKLLRYRTGFALPDLRLQFDGSTFDVSVRRLHSSNPDLIMDAAGGEEMHRRDAEAALSRFIEDVVERLADGGVRSSEVALRWKRVSRSRTDPDEQAFCEAAGALGVDPYAIDEQDNRLIEKAHEYLRGEPLIEFLAGAALGERSESSLDWVTQVESRPQKEAALPGLDEAADQIGPSLQRRAHDRPWRLGYRAARVFRDAVFAPHERFLSLDRIAKEMGSRTFRAVRIPDRIRALVSRGEGSVRIHLHDHRCDAGEQAASRRDKFAFARAIGDALCFRDEPRSIVNDLEAAERQATGRAFAAQLLAPLDQVLAMSEEHLAVDEIADEFEVSSRVIEHQLENQDRIQEACATAVLP